MVNTLSNKLTIFKNKTYNFIYGALTPFPLEFKKIKNSSTEFSTILKSFRNLFPIFCLPNKIFPVALFLKQKFFLLILLIFSSYLS